VPTSYARGPRAERTEAEKHRGGLRLAQEVPDSPRLTSPGRLELLQPLLSSSQVLHLLFSNLLLLLCQLHRLGVQATFPHVGGELMGQKSDVGIFQVL
jgi:hypothetical protein